MDISNIVEFTRNQTNQDVVENNQWINEVYTEKEVEGFILDFFVNNAKEDRVYDNFPYNVGEEMYNHILPIVESKIAESRKAYDSVINAKNILEAVKNGEGLGLMEDITLLCYFLKVSPIEIMYFMPHTIEGVSYFITNAEYIDGFNFQSYEVFMQEADYLLIKDSSIIQ